MKKSNLKCPHTKLMRVDGNPRPGYEEFRVKCLGKNCRRLFRVLSFEIVVVSDIKYPTGKS